MCSNVEIYIEDARNFQKHGQYDLAIASLEKAKELDTKHEFWVEIEKLLSFNYRKLGQYSSALLHINDAIYFAQSKRTETAVNEEYAICLMNKGVIYEAMGKSENAIECYLPAIKILIDLFGASSENFGKIINALLTVGLLYYNKKQYSRAKEFFEQAIPYFGERKETDIRYIKILELLQDIGIKELPTEDIEE